MRRDLDDALVLRVRGTLTLFLNQHVAGRPPPVKELAQLIDQALSSRAATAQTQARGNANIQAELIEGVRARLYRVLTRNSLTSPAVGTIEL